MDPADHMARFPPRTGRSALTSSPVLLSLNGPPKIKPIGVRLNTRARRGRRASLLRVTMRRACYYKVGSRERRDHVRGVGRVPKGTSPSLDSTAASFAPQGTSHQFSGNSENNDHRFAMYEAQLRQMQHEIEILKNRIPVVVPAEEENGDEDEGLEGKGFLVEEAITILLMGWFSKIFKGSKHKTSEGKYVLRHGSDTEDNYQSNSQDSWVENEDIEISIPSSISEEDQNGKNVIVDIESQLYEDEQLARAIQESLNFEPRIDNRSSRDSDGNGNDSPPMPSSYSSLRGRICAGCKLEIDEMNHGRLLGYSSAVWHAGCFRCSECNQLISEPEEFSMSGSTPYHPSCYQEHFYPKCEVCKDIMQIEYFVLSFWSQKYCKSHLHDGTPRCISCDRLTENVEAKYVELDDGRKHCLECMESAIMDYNEFQPLCLDVQEFYEGLDMKIEQEIPITLVNKKSMHESVYGEEHEHHEKDGIIRGLCRSEEQIGNRIRRRPKLGAGNQESDMTTEPSKLNYNFEVTEILILYGLPRLLTGSILAHEMMHAWLRINGYGTLAEDVVEGICQVLAHMWLENQFIYVSDSSVNPTFQKKLMEYYMYNIETHTSPTYGDGYRAGKEAVIKHGLHNTLQHIWTTRNFPS
ncbi:Protein DA1 [Abeliophyllum distichum]|uniref:Protein DA1 n=1 Tax=Abeliophyllum distichum TaxID=126358 RepID=A0ABD1SCG8_9LAMI